MKIATLRVGPLDTGPAFRHTFSAGSTPIDPVFDGEDIYVPLVISARVGVIKARTGRLVRTVQLTDGFAFPSSGAYDGVKVWITTNTGAAVINPEDGTFVTYDFGLQNRGIAVSNGYVYICSPPTSTVFAIPMNTTTGTPARMWTIPTPSGIAADSTGVLVSSSSTGTVYKITGITPAAAPARVTGGSPARIVKAGERFYIADSATAKIYSFAGDGSGTVTTHTPSAMVASAMTFDGVNLVVATQAGTVTAYKVPEMTVAGSAVLEAGTDSLMFDGRNVWVVNSFGNWIEKR